MQIFMLVRLYSKSFFALAVCALTMVAGNKAHADWSIDLSRRQNEMRHEDMQADKPNYRDDNGVAEDSGGREQDKVYASPERAPAAVRERTESPDVIQVPVTTVAQAKNSTAGGLFDSGEPVQEVVILNTDKGFVPSTVRIRKDSHYMIHIVNVNEKDKNVSFVLDGFNSHESTYYGKVKSFEIEPKREGVFSFQCPETSIEGRLVVFAGPGTTNLRVPASTDGMRSRAK